MRLPIRLFLAAVLIAAFALAGTMDDRIPEAKYRDYAKGFAPYVAKVTVGLEGNKFSSATATIISDRWAVTAAHVAIGAESVTLTYPGGKRVVDVVAVPDEFANKPIDPYDVALLHSVEPFGLDFYPPLSEGDEEPGDAVSICGFGLRGRMSTGHPSTGTDDVLLAGSNQIERIADGMIVCTLSPGRSELEYGIAPGDSGGPLFCRGRLAGVNSLTMCPGRTPTSRSGEESGHVQVSRHREWMRGVMEQ